MSGSEALDEVLQALEAQGCSPERAGSSWRATCPAHEDRIPSLSVSEGRDGRVLLTCHAGCDVSDIVVALGLRMAHLFPPTSRDRADHAVVADYVYLDEVGTELFRVRRTDGKGFFQERYEAGVWKGLLDTRRVLYRLPAVIDAGAQGYGVYVVEGEKDADALTAEGLVATTSPMGAGKWRSEYAEALAGAQVVILPDNDEAGRKHGEDVSSALRAVGADFTVLALPGLPDKGDVSDWLRTGGTAALLELLADQAFGPSACDDLAAGVVDEDGAALLDELHAALGRFVVFPSTQAQDAVVAWIAATHAQSAFDHAPRLAIVSPEKRCGKSRLLDIVEATCHDPLISVNVSPAALVRSITEDDPPTILVDEADTVFGSKRNAENNEDVRGILNAGFGRNRPYIRWDMKGRCREDCPTFAMAALASIGDLPDTIMDRAVVVRMRRRAHGESVSPFRARRDGSGLHDLRVRLAAYFRALVGELGELRPDMPVEDWAADTWEPLVVACDAAGGHWPARIREACAALVSASDAEAETASQNVSLLSDIAAIFEEGSEDFLASKTLVERLHGIPDAPWSDFNLTMNGLSWRLRPFGVKPRPDSQRKIRATMRSISTTRSRAIYRPGCPSRPRRGLTGRRRLDS